MALRGWPVIELISQILAVKPVIQRLRTNLAAVVDPHQRRRMAALRIGQLRLG